MNNSKENKKVWFVTGASKGLGLALVKELLANGFQVAATSRNSAALKDAVCEQSEKFLPLEMDLIDEADVQAGIQKALRAFGKIDVVVNNAGFGQIGVLEELSDMETRRNFDVNVFGLLNVIRNVMPHFRAQRSGYIFNISSVGGFSGNFASWGIYCATKFAVAGLTESLAAEAKSFGINATVVYPGYFRTNLLSQDSIMTPKKTIAEYEEARKSQNLHQNELDGNQAGDPQKAAEVLIEAASSLNPPLHLFLGGDAYKLADAKISDVRQDLDSWRDLATSTDFQAKELAA